MHRLDTSRPAAVVSERERAIVEPVRRLHGLPSTRTLAAYEAHLEHLSVWLAGEPLTDRRLARYILHQYETRGRKSVASIVAAVNYYFHDAGWPLPHGPLTHRAILACAAADALRPWTTRTSTASYHTADIAAPQSRARTRARVDEGPSHAGRANPVRGSRKWPRPIQRRVRVDQIGSPKSFCSPCSRDGPRASVGVHGPLRRTPRWPP